MVCLRLRPCSSSRVITGKSSWASLRLKYLSAMVYIPGAQRLATPGMHLPVRIFTEVLNLEKCTARCERLALLCAAIVPTPPNGGNPGCDLLTGCTAPQEELKVGPFARVETKQTDTVRGE